MFCFEYKGFVKDIMTNYNEILCLILFNLRHVDKCEYCYLESLIFVIDEKISYSLIKD